MCGGFYMALDKKLLKEVQRLSNVANTRLREQEKNNMKNAIYYDTLKRLSDMGYDNAKFYRGSKYDNNKQLIKQYEVLQSYINDPTSTKRGIKEQLDFEVYDRTKMEHMSRIELEQQLLKQSKKANARMYRIEKAGLDEGRATGQAKAMLEQSGRKRFSVSPNVIKNMSDEELKLYLQQASTFNNSKTSTIRGIKEQNKLTTQALAKLGIHAPEGKEDMFYNYLNSQQGKALKKRASSEQVIDTIARVMEQGYSIEDINANVTAFLTDNTMTFDEFQERFEKVQWFK